MPFALKATPLSPRRLSKPQRISIAIHDKVKAEKHLVEIPAAGLAEVRACDRAEVAIQIGDEYLGDSEVILATAGDDLGGQRAPPRRPPLGFG